MNSVKSTLIAILLVAVSTLATLMLANFLFVHFYLQAVDQRHFPRALVNSLDGCYQSFYPSTHDKTLRNWTGVVGDSYGAGEGDEFLAGNNDYGIFHKLRERDHQNYLVFARGGFGSINAARELIQCMAFMNDSVFFSKLEMPQKIVVLFYEGNDLNDNINHLAKMGDAADLDNFVSDEIETVLDPQRKLSIYLPIFRILADSGRTLGSHIKRLAKTGFKSHAHAGQVNPKPLAANYVALAQGTSQVPIDPQSAAVELSSDAQRKALKAFFTAAKILKKHYPNSAIEIVYLPSVVTTYDWIDPVKIQSYQTSGEVFTSTQENLRKSLRIRREIENFAKTNGYQFVDTTAKLRQLAQQTLVHGPIDWKHFNRQGNQAVAGVLSP